MENSSSSSFLKIALIVSISIFVLTVIAVGGVYLLKPESITTFMKPQASGSPAEFKQEFVAESSILKNYYRDNKIALPTDFVPDTSPYIQDLALRPAVISREVSWKTGYLFSIASVGGNEDKAREILQGYHQLASDGGDPAKIMSALNSDPAAVQLNKGLAQSYYFVHSTRDRKLFLDPKIIEAFFASPKGTLSEIYKDSITEDIVFFVITDSSDGQYPSYSAWLASASGGKLSTTPTLKD